MDAYLCKMLSNDYTNYNCMFISLDPPSATSLVSAMQLRSSLSRPVVLVTRQNKTLFTLTTYRKGHRVNNVNVQSVNSHKVLLV